MFRCPKSPKVGRNRTNSGQVRPDISPDGPQLAETWSSSAGSRARWAQSVQVSGQTWPTSAQHRSRSAQIQTRSARGPPLCRRPWAKRETDVGRGFAPNLARLRPLVSRSQISAKFAARMQRSFLCDFGRVWRDLVSACALRICAALVPGLCLINIAHRAAHNTLFPEGLAMSAPPPGEPNSCAPCAPESLPKRALGCSASHPKLLQQLLPGQSFDLIPTISDRIGPLFEFRTTLVQMCPNSSNIGRFGLTPDNCWPTSANYSPMYANTCVDLMPTYPRPVRRTGTSAPK